MFRSLIAVGMGLLSLIPAVSQASGTFAVFDIPGVVGASVYPLSINDAGDVTGYYVSGNARAGFIRSHDGTVTSFGAGQNVEATAINAAGTVVGFTSTSQGVIRAANGVTQTYNVPSPDGGYVNTFIDAENNNGDFAGDYGGATLGSGGFIHSSNGALTLINSTLLQVTGLNDAGDLIGSMYDQASGQSTGFVHVNGGADTTFLAPAKTGGSEPPLKRGTFTFAEGINLSGSVTGFAYQRLCKIFHDPCYYSNVRAFVRSPTGEFVVFQILPTAGVNTTGSGTYAFSINDNGAVTGNYNLNHAFIREAAGAVTTFDVPAMVTTNATAINNFEVVAGTCIDSAGINHGYVRTP